MGCEGGEDNFSPHGDKSGRYKWHACFERNFDNHVEGQRRISELQIEWKEAHKEAEIDEGLLQGLERRAYRLLRADSNDWLSWLDNEEFWQPGWRGDDGEPSGDA